MGNILVLYYSVGGTPYGASHFAGLADDLPITDAERALCVAQGRRLAEIALKLKA